MITCPACGHANSLDSTFCTECGKPLKVHDDIGTINTPNPNDARQPQGGANLPELAPGTVFDGRYTIIEKVGQGGMGTVYKATEKLGSIDRNVALKLIRADLLADAKAVDRLMHEGVLTQDIKHDNVVTVYNVGVAQAAPYVAMEYVDGISLREWLRRQRYEDTQKDPPPMGVVAALIRSILDGLAAAHAKGVIHRDLKPENVILLADPTAEAAPLKILDFGIARAPGKSEALTGTGLGTPKYMAPEQETNPAAANPATDLFSLSRIFYELLMGVLPRGAAQSISGGRGDVPPAIDALIGRGLDDSQRQRPQSAAEYRAALDAALGDKQPVKPNNLFGADKRPPESETVEKPKSRKLWYGLGGAALVLIGLANLTPDVDPPNPDNPVNPNPPPPEVSDPSLAMYSGYWGGNGGAEFTVSVDGNGALAGQGTWGGVPAAITADLSPLTDGEPGTVLLGFNDGSVIQGTASIDSEWCHLVVQTPGNGSDFFHVNHASGQPCPTP